MLTFVVAVVAMTLVEVLKSSIILPTISFMCQQVRYTATIFVDFQLLLVRCFTPISVTINLENWINSVRAAKSDGKGK